MKQIYEPVVKAGAWWHQFKTAEAAKIVENIQRDLNVALMNELWKIIFGMAEDKNSAMAGGRWWQKRNFQKRSSGSVWGHCKGSVDLLLSDIKGRVASVIIWNDLAQWKVPEQASQLTM